MEKKFNKNLYKINLYASEQLGNKKLQELKIGRKNKKQMTPQEIRNVYNYITEYLDGQFEGKNPKIMVRAYCDRGIFTLKSYLQDDINIMEQEEYFRGRVDDVDADKFQNFNFLDIIVKVDA